MKHKIINILLIVLVAITAFFYITNYINNYFNIQTLLFSVIIVLTLALFSFLLLRLKPKKKSIKFPSFLLLVYLLLIIVGSLNITNYKEVTVFDFLQYEINIIYKVFVLLTFYLLFFLLVHSVGIKILNKLSLKTKINYPEKHFFAFGVGFIPFIFGVFLFLILGVLYNWVMGVFVIFLILWSSPEIKRAVTDLWHLKLEICFKKNIDILKTAVVAFLLLVFSLSFIAITKPVPITTDDLSAYFNGPDIFVNHHSYQILEQHIRANRGQNTEMIYSGIMALFDTSFIIHFQFFSFFLLLAGIYFFTKNFWGRSYALIAVLTVLTIPWNRFYFGTCKTEFFLAFYCLLLLYLTFLYVYKKNLESPSCLYLFGALGGVALGIKYTAVLLILPLIAFIFLMKFKQGLNKNFFKNLFVAGLLGLLFFSPWLIKNEIYFDNPTHPRTTLFGESDYSFYNQLTTKPKWKKARTQEIDKLRHSIDPESKYNPKKMIYTIWNQSVGNKIDVGQWINFGFIPILILPFYLIYRKEKKKFYLVLLGLSQFVLWYIVGGARPWYNFFGIITLYITLAFLVVDYKKFGYFYITIATIIFFCFFVFFAPNINYLTGNLSKEQYKQKSLGYYDLAEYINDHHKNKENKILMAGIYPTAFIENNHKITMVDKYYNRIGSYIHQGDQEFLKSLKKASIAYIVRSKNRPYINWVKKMGFADKQEYLDQYDLQVPSIYEDIDKLDSFLEEHAHLEYKTPNNLFYLYKINYNESG